MGLRCVFGQVPLSCPRGPTETFPGVVFPAPQPRRLPRATYLENCYDARKGWGRGTDGGSSGRGTFHSRAWREVTGGLRTEGGEWLGGTVRWFQE